MTAPGDRRNRASENKKKRKRHQKIRKLRLRYKNAKTDSERKAILEKLRKISPDYSLEVFQALAS
ncbi:MAG: hypothetical protein HYS55_03510 [Candidatus Omnitrophica bacterium]|nr:hypothetical protein [Candidatus Omnitrophota bacterium]